MRQSVKLGIATVIVAVALFGGASTTSAYAEARTDPDLTDVCEDDAATQINCQIGEDNENVTINQTFNITIQDVFDADLDDVNFGPNLV